MNKLIREKFEILDKYEVSDDLQKTEQTICQP